MNTEIYTNKSAKSTLQKILAMVMGFALTVIAVMGLNSVVFAQSGPADIELPSDVENLQALPGDAEVTLSWDVANDNVGVEGYKVYYGEESVTSQGGSYAYTLEVGDVIEYDVEDLENDTEYHFAVTAYDAAGNESESYSFEVSATPQESAVEAEEVVVPMGDDGKAPTVKSSEGYSNVQIKVTFSEAITLPEEEPQTAFFVEDNLTGAFLPLLDAEILDNDNRVVIIETAPQDSASEYILTAGITIEDTYGNSVRSGTSDTATFLGGEGDYIPVNVDTGSDMLASDTADTGVLVRDTSAVDSSAVDVATDTLAEGLGTAVDGLLGELSAEEMAALEEALESAVEAGDITGGVVLDEEDLTAIDATDDRELFSSADYMLPKWVESVEALEDDQVQVVFSDPVSFVEAETHFMIAEKGDGDVLFITAEELMEDSLTVNLMVDGMEPGHDYVLSIMNVVTTASSEAIDSGDGIPEDKLEEIFEPLVTYKEAGTGLGLASCKNIVKNHKGTISANNNPTTFTIILPN